MRLPFVIPTASAREYDVVTLGLNSIDLITVVAEFPVSNSKQRLQQFARLPGGQMATAAAVCARLGWRARYIGPFGDDDFGAAARTALVREGVDLRAAWTPPGATNQFAVVLVENHSGNRTVLWDRHPALAINPGQIAEGAIECGRVLIVDCHETAAATAAARRARAVGNLTVVDVERVRPGIADLLVEIDAIIAAEAFPGELTGHGDPGRALAAMAEAFQAPLVCVTLGEEGSLARVDGREIRTPGFRMESVDTTGAGDAFRGGLAAGCLLMPEGPIEHVLEYANAVAALNCRGLGAQGGMPTRSEVEALRMVRSRS